MRHIEGELRHINITGPMGDRGTEISQILWGTEAQKYHRSYGELRHKNITGPMWNRSTEISQVLLIGLGGGRGDTFFLFFNLMPSFVH